MRRVGIIIALLAAVGFAFAASVSADEETHTYKLEMYNAFGLVEGSEVKVAGVNAGTVKALEVSEDKTALVEVELTGPLAVLGVDTQCSSEPQSLIAEYFIDCLPAGEPAEDGSVLRKKVQQTVQPDLVQNTLREPFKDRLAILINEFGTALAGNPENLNEAIRLGAPALDDLHAALRLLGRQNTVIRDLNVDSDEIIGKLADRRTDVAAFINNAGEAAAASAERSDDLSRDFDLLDDFLAELQPTMVELGNVARETTPLLSDLRGAAPQLNELAVSLPPFNRAAQDSLVTLGRAAVPGTRALNRGVKNGTFEALSDSADQGPRTAELISDFARDVDDPGRIVEIDDRAAKACNDDETPCFSTGRDGPTGYTGLEGLLNYAYYQAGSTNQYDTVGHLLHFTLYDVFTGACGNVQRAAGLARATATPSGPTGSRPMARPATARGRRTPPRRPTASACSARTSRESRSPRQASARRRRRTRSATPSTTRPFARPMASHPPTRTSARLRDRGAPRLMRPTRRNVAAKRAAAAGAETPARRTAAAATSRTCRVTSQVICPRLAAAAAEEEASTTSSTTSPASATAARTTAAAAGQRRRRAGGK